MEPGMSDKCPVHDLRQSSVVPAHITGDRIDKKLTKLDLSLKLHYIKGVYFFGSEAALGLTIEDIKKPMFLMLTSYNLAAGRIRRDEETGRPFIKCNDSGVRVLEGSCEITMEEALGFEEVEVEGVHERRVSMGGTRVECLVHDGVLGPDIGFSPLVYVQFTRFKCGGLAIGVNWAHVLGDPISASSFINTWAQVLKGQKPPETLHAPSPWTRLTLSDSKTPTYLKQVEPRGDHWLPTSSPKMKSHSFRLTPKQLSTLSSGTFHKDQNGTHYFQALSALVWKSVSKTRGDSGPNVITICTILTQGRDLEIPCNKLTFSTVQTKNSPAETGLNELAILIGENQQEESSSVGKEVEEDVDYVAYGTRLTFVDMEGADIYGLEVKGHKPVFVDYRIGGVGDEGAVVLLPGPGGAGRTLTVTLPEDQLVELGHELDRELGIA